MVLEERPEEPNGIDGPKLVFQCVDCGLMVRFFADLGPGGNLTAKLDELAALHKDCKLDEPEGTADA